MRFSGPILSRLEGAGRIVDRRDERLPTAWIRGADTPVPTTTTLVADAGAPIAWPGNTPTVIVMLSGRCASAERALDDAFAAGARAYVIAPEGWGEGVRGGPFARFPKAQVLVRRVARPPATAVWSPEHAWIWFGDDAAEPAWRMPLDAPQAAALRLACLRLFWHHGLDEGYNRDGAVAFRPCGPRPFDVPEARDDAALRITEGAIPLYEGGAEAIVYTDAAATLPTRAARVWCPPSGADHATLAHLAERGAEVVWAPRALPRCFVGPTEARVTPMSARWSMSLKLTAAQREDLKVILRAPTPWRFAREVSLREIEAGADLRVQLAGSDSAVPLKVDEQLVAAEVRAPSLRACDEAAPTSWPTPGPLTLTAHWRWAVLPPTLPKGSKDDPLVEAWRQLDRDFATRSKAAVEALDRARQQKSTWAKTFEALKGALLGFDRTQGGLEQRLIALAEHVPSRAGPARARDLVGELAEVVKEVAAFVRDVDAAEQKAREDKERAEKLAEFERRQKEDARARDERQKDLDLHRKRLAALEAQAEALSTATEGESPEQAKDREVARKRNHDEQRSLEKFIKLLEGQVQDFDKALARTFVYRPTPSKPGTPGGASFVPAAVQNELRPPTDALPSVGRLVVAKQRYLAIQAWEDLDAGEREAARLNASLVADLEGA